MCISDLTVLIRRIYGVFHKISVAPLPGVLTHPRCYRFPRRAILEVCFFFDTIIAWTEPVCEKPTVDDNLVDKLSVVKF